MLQDFKEEIEFLTQCPTDIRDGCIVRLYDMLSKLNLKDMNFLERLRVLATLLDWCMEFDANQKITQAVLIRWDCKDEEFIDTVMNPVTFDPDGILGDLAASTMFSGKLLKHVLELYPYSTPLTILDSHIRTRSEKSMSFPLVVDRLLTAYELDDIEPEEWNQLLKSVEETQILKTLHHTNSIVEYIQDRIANSPYVKIGKSMKLSLKPKYVNTKSGESRDVYLNRPVGPSSQEISEIVPIIKDFLEKTEVEEADTFRSEEELASLCVSLASNAVGTNGLGDAVGDNGNTVSGTTYLYPIDRFYGPANPILGFDCIGANGAGKSPGGNGTCGPCRMFYCVCREFDEDDEELLLPEEVLEEAQELWFTGKCETCDVKISNYRYSVRFPVSGGGWEGCYCSFDCIRKTQRRPVFDHDLVLINSVENIINEVGIYEDS